MAKPLHPALMATSMMAGSMNDVYWDPRILYDSGRQISAQLGWIMGFPLGAFLILRPTKEGPTETERFYTIEAHFSAWNPSAAAGTCPCPWIEAFIGRVDVPMPRLNEDGHLLEMGKQYQAYASEDLELPTLYREAAELLLKKAQGDDMKERIKNAIAYLKEQEAAWKAHHPIYK